MPKMMGENINFLQSSMKVLSRLNQSPTKLHEDDLPLFLHISRPPTDFQNVSIMRVLTSGSLLRYAHLQVMARPLTPGEAYEQAELDARWNLCLAVLWRYHPTCRAYHGY